MVDGDGNQFTYKGPTAVKKIIGKLAKIEQKFNMIILMV